MRGNLTNTERQIAILIASGLTTDEIRQILCIEEGTLKNHLNDIFRKEAIVSSNPTYKRINLMRKFMGVDNE